MMNVGTIREIVRYPIKSMAGVATETAALGWHGLDGDRRFAFRRWGEDGGFPWLSASRLPALVLHQPMGLDVVGGEPTPTHVRTPEGTVLGLRSPELTSAIGARLGNAVELMRLKHGIFDEAALSILSLSTMATLGREAGLDLDYRRFRPNLVVEIPGDLPFPEDAWVGGILRIGDPDVGPVVHVSQRDLRCSMVNLHPETAAPDDRVMKAISRLNQCNAGVYATVLRPGPIGVGDRLILVPASDVGARGRT